MAIEGFNYQEFAQNLTAQAQELVPQDFAPNDKQYVVNTLLNFSTLAGEALYNDTESNFSADQAMMITQIIAEWAFHKSVDLIRSGIPQEFWDSVMQKIAFTIFEVAKQAFKQSIPQDQMLQLIEHHVKKTYVDAIAELKDKGFIDEALMEQASSQSNIDAMMQQMSEDQQLAEQVQNGGIPPEQSGAADMPSGGSQPQQGSTSSKIMKLATVALLFQKMKQEKVQSLLDKFNPEDAQTVIKYMGMPNLGDRVSVNTALKCLNEIRTSIPKAQDLTPSKIVLKLQKVTEGIERRQLESMLQTERMKVKRLVFNALEGEYYDVPPKVANIIAAHIQDSYIVAPEQEDSV